MNEEQIKKIVTEIIDPLKDKHIAFMDEIITALENAFMKGIEVGKSFSDHKNDTL